MQLDCWLNMSVNPRTNFTYHNANVTFGFLPALYFNATFNNESNNTYLISTKADKSGTYPITAYEKNYNMTLNKNITVLYSKRFHY